MDQDLALALKLQEEYDMEFKQCKKKKSFLDVGDENSNASVVDPSLEFTDPTPDVHKMFVGFDKRFFWSSLGSVEVMWSPRMTHCAGICRYRSGSGATSIHLSLPLLKLRPRKDLVETLLHEMIHAYLFVTRNNRDRDGHGPEFQSHMHRINKNAGTNITVYHSFHDEVNLYKTHWWRCNGPCQHRKPFYGVVRRTMNRAPGPNDFWFAEHQQSCGGEFIKIKEPENYKSKKRTKNAAKEMGTLKGKTASNLGKKMPEFFKPSVSKAGFPNGGLRTASGGSSTRTITSKVPQEGKLPSCSQPVSSPSPSVSNIVPFSGQGHTLGKNSIPLKDKPWLKRLNNTHTSANNSKSLFVNESSSVKKINGLSPKKKTVCNSSTSNKPINSYFSSSSDIKKARIDTPKVTNNVDKKDEPLYKVACPVCNKSVNASEVNDHLDLCLNSAKQEEVVYSRCVVCDNKLDKVSDQPALCYICESGACSSDTDVSFHEDRTIACPMCDRKMNIEDLERHLEECIEEAGSDKNTTRFVDEKDDDLIIEYVKYS